MNIVDEILQKLNDKRFRQSRPEEVKAALKSLTDSKMPLLEEYFSRVQGPMGSDVTSLLLLDPVAGNPNVVSLTSCLREQYALPRNYIAVSDLCADALVVYDVETDKVFNVDFEGGLDLLKAGKLPVMENSFEELLRWFFDVRGAN